MYKQYFTIPTTEQWTRYEGPSVFKAFILKPTSESYTYLNLEIDTVRFADSMLEYIGKEEIATIQRLVLEVKDVAYFGHFCMDTLKSMPKLTELELLSPEGDTYSWSRGGRVQLYETLDRDFREAKYNDPAWECPRVTILNKNTGEVWAVIEAGALIPGWKEG